jgi:hypothetical protein
MSIYGTHRPRNVATKHTSSLTDQSPHAGERADLLVARRLFHALRQSLVFVAIVPVAAAALGADDVLTGRPLFFREDWRQTPAAEPVTQEHVANPEVRLSLHGPAASQIKKSHHDEIPNDPWYIWSGDCAGNWAISLHRDGLLVDLSGDAAIRWQTKQSGPHVLKLVLELADGQWLVSRQGFGETPDWHEFSAPISQFMWQQLDIDSVTAGRRIASPDLTRVRSVGWTDLTRGEGSPGSTRVDWIEVYGRTVPAGVSSGW